MLIACISAYGGGVCTCQEMLTRSGILQHVENYAAMALAHMDPCIVAGFCCGVQAELQAVVQYSTCTSM